MKKLKDLIYDYNDILLAIVIIIIAGIVIFWKVSDIMAYPSFARNQAEQQSGTDVNITDGGTTPIDVDPIVAPGEDIESGKDTPDAGTESQGGTSSEGQPEQQPQVDTFGVTKDTLFTVPSGYSCNKIATKLESEKLCKAEDFTKAVTSLGAETKLRAGDFTLPAGSTAEGIVKIIANIK